MSRDLPRDPAARALYRAAAAQADTDPVVAPDTPAAAAADPAAAATALTDRGRALYEAGVVPVRDIARLVGVSERTLYHYVRRGGWRRRWPSRGADSRAIHGIEAGDPHAVALARSARDAQAMAAADTARRVRTRTTSRAIDAQMRLLDLLGAALVDLARGYAQGGARYAAAARDLQALVAAEMRAALDITPR